MRHDVNDKSLKVSGGLQRIQTFDGYVTPMSVHAGLPYVTMRPFTDHEWDTLPHVLWTADEDWDPSVLDYDLEGQANWEVLACPDGVPVVAPPDALFDAHGNYRLRKRACGTIFL